MERMRKDREKKLCMDWSTIQAAICAPEHYMLHVGIYEIDVSCLSTPE